MKKLLAILAILTMTSTAQALEWGVCCEYLTRGDPTATYTIQKFDDGIRIVTWKSTVAKPTKADLVAIEATAVAWKTSTDNTKTADYDAWTLREKAMLKYLIKQINALRVQAGGQALTKAQVKAGIKAEM